MLYKISYCSLAAYLTRLFLSFDSTSPACLQFYDTCSGRPKKNVADILLDILAPKHHHENSHETFQELYTQTVSPRVEVVSTHFTISIDSFTFWLNIAISLGDGRTSLHIQLEHSLLC